MNAVVQAQSVDSEVGLIHLDGLLSASWDTTCYGLCQWYTLRITRVSQDKIQSTAYRQCWDLPLEQNGKIPGVFQDIRNVLAPNQADYEAPPAQQMGELVPRFVAWPQNLASMNTVTKVSTSIGCLSCAPQLKVTYGPHPSYKQTFNFNCNEAAPEEQPGQLPPIDKVAEVLQSALPPQIEGPLKEPLPEAPEGDNRH